MPHLTIGKLAERTGVSTDTLRYYEKMELLQPGERNASGYRLYHYDTVRLVRFIRGAKSLHFSLAEIRGLLSLTPSDPSKCKKILKRTEAKIHEAQAKIIDLQEIQSALSSLVEKPDQSSKRSVMDHIRKHTRLLSIGVAAFLSCLPDVAFACVDSCLYEDKPVRVEEPHKRSKLQPAR